MGADSVGELADEPIGEDSHGAHGTQDGLEAKLGVSAGFDEDRQRVAPASRAGACLRKANLRSGRRRRRGSQTRAMSSAIPTAAAP
jgi:hypothetical protein